MNLLETICKELGVEIGEHWLGNDGMKYTIGKTGKIFQFDKNGFHIMHDYNRWEDIFTGKLKPKYIPEVGDVYFTPEIDNYDKYSRHTWYDKDIDRLLYERDLIFETKEEAIECATNMLDLTKNGI